MRPVPYRSKDLVPVAVIAALTLGLFVPISAPAGALGYSPRVDEAAAYEGQTTCAASAKPGTAAFARHLLRSYPATRSLGLMRGCSTGGRSEHKDGRAFDWGADVANAATRRAAFDFIRRVLATDAAGNQHALARRLGLMYFIYNDTIWASYRDFVPRPYLHPACRTKRTCSRSLRHLNHVHFSLGYAGAAGQTSWYRARNVTSLPVRFPETRDLDPDRTAVTGFVVAATGVLTSSPFVLRAGVTYRIVATGLVRYGAGNAVGDAHCTRAADQTTYEPTPREQASEAPDLGFLGWDGWGDPVGSLHAASPSALPQPLTHGLVIHGGLRWEGSCRGDHTYEAWYTPPSRQRLQLQYVDALGSDNSGAFSVYVARDDITLGSLARR